MNVLEKKDLNESNEIVADRTRKRKNRGERVENGRKGVPREILIEYV